MIRRRAWTTAAIAIAAGAAVIVWRARVRRTRPRATAAWVRVPGARPVEAPTPAVASASVSDDATDVTDLAAADDVTTSGDQVSALRVFAATDPTVDETVTDEAAVDEPPGEPTEPALDLEQIASDLEGVAAALARLDDGTYWTDEVTGEPLVEELLVADPVARRNR